MYKERFQSKIKVKINKHNLHQSDNKTTLQEMNNILRQSETRPNTNIFNKKYHTWIKIEKNYINQLFIYNK